MPDVFISYARVDEPQAKRLADALREAGIDVWWDADLIGGEEFRSKIRELIGSARRVIVLWSKTSVDSGFVIDEANEARRQHKLVPVSIDGTPPPFGFGNLHTLRFENPQTDLGKIVAAVRQSSASLRPPITTANKRRSIFIATGALALVALIAAGYWLVSTDKISIAAASSKQRLALVIGNAVYPEANAVPNAERDVDRVADELQKRGFKVIKKINADRDQMVRAITDFQGALATLGGIGLFYYAGDGGYVDSNYLMLPVDMSKSAIRKKGGVSISRLLRDFKDSLSPSIVNNGTVVIFSTAKRQRAATGPANGHSPFNDAFVSALAAENDDLSDFFRRMSATFAQTERRANDGARQIPYMESASNAEFFFNKRDRDRDIGLLRIVVLDSNRDEPSEKEALINAK